jgi:hypothetical protein
MRQGRLKTDLETNRPPATIGEQSRQSATSVPMQYNQTIVPGQTLHNRIALTAARLRRQISGIIEMASRMTAQFLTGFNRRRRIDLRTATIVPMQCNRTTVPVKILHNRTALTTTRSSRRISGIIEMLSRMTVQYQTGFNRPRRIVVPTATIVLQPCNRTTGLNQILRS